METFVDYTFTTTGKSIIFDRELKPSDLGVSDNDMYVVNTSGSSVIFRKFELEDTVIKLHEIARHLEKTTNEIEIAKKIRQMADEISDKVKGIING